MNAELLSKLGISRKELLDLGLRNSLVNHPSKAKQVKVVDERSKEIFRILVNAGRRMTFDPLSDARLEQAANVARDDPASRVEELDWNSMLAQPEDAGEGTADRHADNRLQTALGSESLQARLLSIHNDARGYVEEQGVNILFLALGFLHWYESASAAEPRRAPLLLVPVELERSNARERFQMAYSGEDIGDNLSLIEKMKAEFGTTLPAIGEVDEFDVDAYFDAIRMAIAANPRWKVEANDVTLGFFSFGKFLMYRDLDARLWEGDEAPALLTALLGEGFREPESPFGSETRIDEVLSPADVCQVKDADSSQILAILDVMSGRNLVLQGPPGTGKSQTITNIIAECIGAGRKILFVAEKMAALDVVKRRLDETGLGDAVLELHSHKTNRKLVLEELGRTLYLGRPVAGETDDDIGTLIRLRDTLNAYSDAVNRPIGATRNSFVNALGRAIEASQGKEVSAPFDFSSMRQWTDAAFRQARMLVEAMDRYLADAGAPADNPFCAARLTEYLPSQRAALEREIDQARKATAELVSQGGALASGMSLAAPARRADIDIICRAARRAMSAPHLQGVALRSGDWQLRRDELGQLCAAGRALQVAHTRFDDSLIDEAWSQDLLAVRQAYITKGDKWWRFMSGEFRAARARMQGLGRGTLPKSSRDMLEMIDAVLACQTHRKHFDALESHGRNLFGAQWKGVGSDWDVLSAITEWVVTLYRDVGNGELPEGVVAFLSGSPALDALKPAVDALEQLLKRHGVVAAQLASRLDLQPDDAQEADWGMPLDLQHARLERWLANLDSLEKLVRFNVLCAQLKTDGIGFVAPRCLEWREERGALLRLFDYSWYNGLVETAYSESPEIRQFDRVQHEYTLEQFGRLDHLLFRHNQVRLALAHWQTLPSPESGGEMGIIARELNKKRRLLPIRSLIKEAGRAIQAIKPVFMMSPMSIATYIPPGAVHFDLVVFDEASQVKPVDAFGALLRGRQAVVVGDSKQLPPTSFFDTLLQSDPNADEDLEQAGDMESVLSLFLGKGAPERMLRWHYRSRHHSLIAISNNEFYDNRLVVFPSPGVNPLARGLRIHHVQDAVYDRGKTRTNPGEAKAVAAAVMKHAREFPDLTLGVVAFSVAQRDAIEMEIERSRRFDDSCEPFFAENQREPFFIKNLESVQGDERDVIFISIGYGRAENDFMTMSFGPLNREGGERRLNVLISRSRLAMEVFCNFRSGDLDLARSNVRGIVALKNFLAYAETGVLETPQATGREPDSAFEQSVIRALSGRGYQLDPQVGTAGFFIDIGVCDTDRPGAYMLGIECDGATYHSSRSARDRDRLRQEVLEGLGWRLHRIWSTDWYRNPLRELERAVAAIENARIVATPFESASVPAQREHVLVIEREAGRRTDAEAPADYPSYEKASIHIPLGGTQLHEAEPAWLAGYVARVVAVESPMHVSDVVRRITEGCGLKRAGNRIQGAVQAAIDVAARKGEIRECGDFLWQPGMTEARIRDRSLLDAGARKLEYVSPEEIRAALLAEIARGFSMSIDNAMTAAARALGFLRLSMQAQDVFRKEIRILVDDGRLKRNGELLSAS